jgi:hypothetical protein
LLFSACVWAGDPDYSGEWKLNSTLSSVGRLPEPPAATLIIVQKGVRIHCTAAGGDDAPASWDYTTDHKEAKYRIGNTSRSSILKWEGNALLVNTLVNTRDKSYSVMDRWKISRDGGTLTIRRQIETLNGEAEATLVYQKQDGAASAGDR